MSRSDYYKNREKLVYSPNEFSDVDYDHKNKGQLIDNSKVIKDYTNIITGENTSRAIKKYYIKHNNNVVENPKQIGERKFVDLGGLKCKENTRL